jgi:WD40 repeat protein
MVSPRGQGAQVANRDNDETRTSDAGGDDIGMPAPERPEHRLAAPLQYRDPDRYEIVGEHGRGGLGVVSRAHDRELGRNVAIKELLKRGDLGEVRFLREAMITAQLEHPGIVPVHEAGRWPDGTPFYVMKLVAGRSLKELIEERATVDERLGLLHHVIAVADAVAYAHRRKIIHRDLKPANVIAGDFGETVVIDWGLAKDLNRDDDGLVDVGIYRVPGRDELTVEGSVLGTPLYMAPEQARGEPVDQRADVYAIGAMLWELCSLQRVPPEDPREFKRALRRAQIDADLAAIIVKALAPEPRRRYRGAGELAADLKAFKSGARIGARRYSLLAMLARWIRRHRALAISVSAAAALAITAAIWFVRNIAVERDRADSERDKARLSEAAALLETDPTRARELLASLSVRTPRYALLRSRAERRAAAHVVKQKRRIESLHAADDGSAFALQSTDGELYDVDPGSGKIVEVARGLSGPLVRGDGRWLYALSESAASATIASSPPGITFAAGPLLAEPTSRLVHSGGQILAFEPSGELYRLDASGPVLIDQNLRAVAGNDHLLVKCTRDGRLTVARDGIVSLESTCAANESLRPLAVAGDHYASLRDPRTLAIDDRAIALSTPITGEFQLALSSMGVAVLADFSDKAWFVRPDGDRTELVAAHTARPFSVAARDHLAAWGYSDGAVVALDTRTGMAWKFIGHPDAVVSVAIDARRLRLVSASNHEVRFWDLTPSPATTIRQLGCSPFHLVSTRDASGIALECSDGSTRFWERGIGEVREMHRHADLAFGLARWNEMMCSGSWDGSVRCSTPGGREGRTVLSGSGRIRWLASCPDDACLLVATSDKVWKVNDRTRPLFAQGEVPYRIAPGETGKLASGGWKGSLVLYDLSGDREIGRAIAHTGWVTSVAWRGAELWTAGEDGALKRWNTAHGLELRETVRPGGALSHLVLLDRGWAAAVDNQVLHVEPSEWSAPLHLDLGRWIRDVQVSPDQRYIAAVAFDEVILVDRERRAIATMNAGAGELGCVRFLDPDTLALCGQSSISTAPIRRLDYTTFSLSNERN